MKHRAMIAGVNFGTCNSNSSTGFLIPLVLIILLIFPIYTNTLNASWQLDDDPNIVNNSRLHIDNLLPSTLYKTFFAYPGTEIKLYRPLPMLTFALNWYFGRDDPAGYHLINILIHIFTSFVLLALTWTLFRTPILKGRYSKQDVYFISLLSATLWAINPIQTQAVTYIVQRMAAMATLFYLLGILFYIKARISQTPLKRVLLFLLCFISLLCALGSKENAAIFPIALILVEISFFPKLIMKGLKFPFPRLVAEISTIVFLLSIFMYSKGNFFFFLRGYDSIRYFDLWERLITQPRVIIFYLTQIFYPIPQRLSVSHDIQVATSIIDPWTTLPTILIIVILIFVGISQLKKIKNFRH